MRQSARHSRSKHRRNSLFNTYVNGTGDELTPRQNQGERASSKRKENKEVQEPRFIQIGTTAARDPVTGEFLPSEPIYAEVMPEIEEAAATTFRNVGKLFAEKMRQYVDGGGIDKGIYHPD